MKTTLVIDDSIMVRLREEAARRGRTLSELVEAALRGMLKRFDQETTTKPGLAPLPTFSSRPRVDITDRDALYDAMEGHDECS